MKRTELLNKIKTGIREKDPNAEIFLFGSRARRDNKSESDWDFLILSSEDKITFELESSMRDSVVDLELESGEILSLLIYSKKDWLNKKLISPLFDNVRAEGIII